MTRTTPARPAEDPQRAWRRHRLLVRVGQALMAAGAIVAIIHWLAHLKCSAPASPPAGSTWSPGTRPGRCC
jgi:hypothetical protein